MAGITQIISLKSDLSHQLAPYRPFPFACGTRDIALLYERSGCWLVVSGGEVRLQRALIIPSFSCQEMVQAMHAETIRMRGVYGRSAGNGIRWTVNIAAG
jgi:hypothetical protein